MSRFFFDIAQPVALHGGETHRYLDDEGAGTWPLEKAIKIASFAKSVGNE